MSVSQRIETALEDALANASRRPAPPRLAAAIRDAVCPGGARVRPRLCISVAEACGDDRPHLTDAAAAAIELVHSASLVHDDMPCFDDAPLRRGKPSVHRAHGEPLALLAGDTLIVLAFATLARAGRHQCERSTELILDLAEFTGMPGGICAGQGWESEPAIDLSAYHQSKTGALFVAATRMGAVAAGADPEPWTELGARIGEAFQVADDLRDVLCTEATLGKPVGQDAALHRPNAVADLGVSGAVRRLQDILAGAISSIPACPGEEALCAIVRAQAERLMPVAAARQMS